MGVSGRVLGGETMSEVILFFGLTGGGGGGTTLDLNSFSAAWRASFEGTMARDRAITSSCSRAMSDFRAMISLSFLVRLSIAWVAMI
jgi:hypothetical protein